MKEVMIIGQEVKNVESSWELELSRFPWPQSYVCVPGLN